MGIGRDGVVLELLRLCNPKGEARNDVEFEVFWHDAIRCVDSIADVTQPAAVR